MQHPEKIHSTAPPPFIPGHTVLLYGEATVWQGDELVGVFRNKETGIMLRGIVNYLWASAMNASTVSGGTTGTMRVGTGTGATGDGTTALVTEVATAPSSIAFTTDNPSSGTYRFKVTATWNAGVLAAVTVTEIGIKGNSMNTLSSTSVTSNHLLARLSSTDGEFVAFLVDTTKPLVIEYRFTMAFA